MGYWPKKYLGDADDLLAYSTPKMVKVRDWRLGGAARKIIQTKADHGKPNSFFFVFLFFI
eukprot:m.513698 g.513698  ORF g.513698 m.513698 type:complete len:60 (-) comp21906_c1_seq14:3876-4055(-)